MFLIAVIAGVAVGAPVSTSVGAAVTGAPVGTLVGDFVVTGCLVGEGVFFLRVRP